MPWWPWVVTVVDVAISVAASCHVVLTKRQTRSAIGWVGLIWVSPFVGTLLYVVFGINRIRRKARSLRRGRVRWPSHAVAIEEPEELATMLGVGASHLTPLARLGAVASGRLLWTGNRVDPLVDGDEAYPAMVAAIDGARESVALATYLFYPDAAGRRFHAALRGAVERGVAVRVLIDDVGSRYGWRSSVPRLRRAGVPVATFIPTLAPAWLRFVNLRMHRKILIADGRLAFTGGMNINEQFVHGDGWLDGRREKRGRHHDLHFRVEGPVVGDLMRVFVDDWEFSTGERLEGEAWFPVLAGAGATAARCVDDGPDDDIDRLLLTMLGAVSQARRSIVIVTPYFFPDEALVSALEVAAMRGVEVELIVPRRSNLPYVDWAMPPFLEQVLEGGCRVYQTPPPFDHTKLMIVDEAWAFLGSANVDARSFRLNFEVNLECYGTELAAALRPIVEARRAISAELTLRDLREAPLLQRLRNGVFRLLSPYL
ncbi:MAG: cardiolipin synthase [Isosphaeraceae bacterium]|jgi:cardiolipin synthase|nr:MAG: cardiolipin synthase [Isosphaeraceae bacterium]